MQPSNFRSSCCCVRVEPYFCDQGWRLFKAKRCSELRNRHHGRNLHVDFVRKVWSADHKSVPFLVNQRSKILDVKTSSTDCEAHVYPRLEVSKQLFHHFRRNICRIHQIRKKVRHFRDKRGLPDKCVTLYINVGHFYRRRATLFPCYFASPVLPSCLLPRQVAHRLSKWVGPPKLLFLRK